MIEVRYATVCAWWGVALSCGWLAGCGGHPDNTVAQYEQKFGGKEALLKEMEYANKLPMLRFSVEPGFRGSIELRLDRTNGMDLAATNGVIFIPVPKDGEVAVRTFAPFQHDFRLSGQYTSGVGIPEFASFSAPPPPEVVVIDGGGLMGGTGYPPEGVYWFFVGSEQDRRGAPKK